MNPILLSRHWSRCIEDDDVTNRRKKAKKESADASMVHRKRNDGERATGDCCATL